MVSKSFSRRTFLKFASQGMAAAVVSASVVGCINSKTHSDFGKQALPVEFKHGVASGDPLANAVILWTRITPMENSYRGDVAVSWELSETSDFKQLLRSGNTQISSQTDYTLKVDAIGLAPNTRYYFRFTSNGVTSGVGVTKTLPIGDIKQVKLLAMSCSNYPAGYFNVYGLAAEQENVDAVLHLGDYIYEYAADGYGTERATELGRMVTPETELLSLADYRTRYALYRRDSQLQKLHASAPFIAIWDDHEIANDAYVTGAENHNDGEGDYQQRKLAAMQAYFEWLPIRPQFSGDNQHINRHFSFGNLVDLYSLDTRIIGRDKQLDYANYKTNNDFNLTQFNSDVKDETRTMLGAEQLTWLQDQLINSSQKWQVLGQQVLMGRMNIPAAIATQQLSISAFSELATIANLAGRAQAEDPSLTADQLTYLKVNKARLTPEVVAQLKMPKIPYNLDAWDGYAAEREQILATAKTFNKNLVVLAGDTHNAWANELKDKNNQFIGVEFATPSVTSPGLEQYLDIKAEDIPKTEAGITQLITDLKYLNAADRGFMAIQFDSQQVVSTWHYVNTIHDTQYHENQQRRVSMKYAIGTRELSTLS